MDISETYKLANNDRGREDYMFKGECNGFSISKDLQDDVLWEHFRSGNELSCSIIYTRYYSSLYNYGRQFQKDETSVEDAIQDLFIYLWKKRKDLKAVKNVKYYLYKSLRRRLISDSKISHLIDASTNNYFLIECSTESNIIDSEIEVETKQVLNKALQALSPKHREAIFLRFYENFSYQEIALLLNISVDNTYKIVSRALDMLKSYLKMPSLIVALLLQTYFMNFS